MKDFFKYMMACICAIFIINFLIFIVFFVSMIGIAVSGNSSTSVSSHSVYKIDLNGTLSERISEDPVTTLQQQMLGRDEAQNMGLNDLLANIKKAKENDKIDGIYLHGGQLSGGLASMREFRNALLDFKQSGKFIIAYADGYGQANYYLASTADSIFVNPYGAIDWHGLSMTVNFYKKLSENLGIEMQIFRVGNFKSAVEPFMLTAMSDDNRYQNQVMLNELWNVMCFETAQARHLESDSLKALADSAISLKPAYALLDAKLADKLVYEADMDSILKLATGTDDYKILTHKQMTSVEGKSKKSSNKLAVVYAEGDIVDQGTSGIVGNKFVKTLGEVADNDDVKAVVLRVNSPGGSAFASEQIWYAVQQLKHKKPVVVSMGDYAASGGYYISCGADKIFAQPTTLTGSIGIFGMIPNYKKLADKVGVTNDNVKTSRYANLDENLVSGQPTDEEKALVQQSINYGYDLFTRRCAEGRGMTQEQIFEIAGGRVWVGNEALKQGLVDSIGGIDDAIKYAAVMGKIEDDYVVESYPAEQSWQEKLLETFDAETLIARRIEKMTSPFNSDIIDFLCDTQKYCGVQTRMLERVNF